MQDKISKKLKSFPTSPGVYIFKNNAGEVLYVGKATSLKDRVGSYFDVGTGRDLSLQKRPIETMIGKVTDIEIKKTETVLEAYILEQELIKEWQPKYNIDGKDDKSFCYVIMTKEDFPRILIVRKTDLEKIKNNDSQIKNTKLIKKLPTTYYSLKTIFGPYVSKKNIEIALKILRKIFPYHSKKENSEKGCLDFQIGLCPGPYAGAISKKDYAKNILGIGMILSGKKKSLLDKLKKEMTAQSEKQEFEEAAILRNQIFALQHIQDVALISSRDEALPRLYGNAGKMRIEGYDISNISGTASVGSMVVFDNVGVETKNFASLQSNKSQYRKFRIKTVFGANDVASMQEVLSRRFGNNWPRPDLIILDGGRGHLNMARRVLKSFHLEIPLLAVAKGPTRKKLDRYSFGNVPDVSENILEQIRDEAHRFAIGYHKKLRGKNFLKELE